ncbi:MAG: RidA family protein [Planctomycetota bacterium]
MDKQAIATTGAPKAIGPYSQAIIAGDQVWCSGQIAIDPRTGEVVEGGMEAETRQILRNLKAVLEAAGSALDRVVKTTVYMTDLREFARMNEIYGEYFPGVPPARATVEVGALPKGVSLEIEAVALRRLEPGSRSQGAGGGA